MPLPARLARFNRRVSNPLTRTFAGRVPPFAIVEHHGRTSGREYRTPVMAFGAGQGIIIALTYGAETHWVKNVLAAGGCVLVRRGRRASLGNPRLVGERDGLPQVPGVVRPVLRLLDVAEFLVLDPDDVSPRGSDG
jgi:deazaflavin-dependent oxidoreductase (nitroreductase family)